MRITQEYKRAAAQAARDIIVAKANLKTAEAELDAFEASHPGEWCYSWSKVHRGFYDARWRAVDALIDARFRLREEF